MYKLLRSESWHRPYRLNGKKVTRLIIYADGKEVLKTNSGWFETQENGHATNSDVLSVSLPAEPKRAVKTNLDRKDNFYLKDKKCDYKDGYIVYLHRDTFKSVKLLGERVAMENEEETNYLHYAEIEGEFTFQDHRLKEDNEECIDGDKLEYFEAPTHKILFSYGYYRTAKSKYGNKVKAIEKLLNDEGMHDAGKTVIDKFKKIEKIVKGE